MADINHRGAGQSPGTPTEDSLEIAFEPLAEAQSTFDELAPESPEQLEIEALFSENGEDDAAPKLAEDILLAQAETQEAGPEEPAPADEMVVEGQGAETGSSGAAGTTGAAAGTGAMAGGQIAMAGLGAVGLGAAVAAAGSSSSAGSNPAGSNPAGIEIDADTDTVTVSSSQTVDVTDIPGQPINVVIEDGVAEVTFEFIGDAAGGTLVLDDNSVLRGAITISGGTLNVQDADVSDVESFRANSGIEIRPSQLLELTEKPDFSIGSDSEEASAVNLVFLDDDDTTSYNIFLEAGGLPVVGEGSETFSFGIAPIDPEVFEGDVAAADVAVESALPTRTPEQPPVYSVRTALALADIPEEYFIDLESGTDLGQLPIADIRSGLTSAEDIIANASNQEELTGEGESVNIPAILTWMVEDSAENIQSYLNEASDNPVVTRDAARVRVTSKDAKELLDSETEFTSNGGLVVIYDGDREVFDEDVDQRLDVEELQDALSNFDFVVLFDRLAPAAGFEIDEGFLSVGLSDVVGRSGDTEITGSGGTIEVRLFPETRSENPNVKELGFDLSGVSDELALKAVITGESESSGEIDLTGLEEVDVEQFNRLEDIKFVSRFADGNVLVGNADTLSEKTVTVDSARNVAVRIVDVTQADADTLDTSNILADAESATVTVALAEAEGESLSDREISLLDADLTGVDVLEVADEITARVDGSLFDGESPGPLVTGEAGFNQLTIEADSDLQDLRTESIEEIFVEVSDGDLAVDLSDSDVDIAVVNSASVSGTALTFDNAQGPIERIGIVDVETNTSTTLNYADGVEVTEKVLVVVDVASDIDVREAFLNESHLIEVGGNSANIEDLTIEVFQEGEPLINFIELGSGFEAVTNLTLAPFVNAQEENESNLFLLTEEGGEALKALRTVDGTAVDGAAILDLSNATELEEVTLGGTPDNAVNNTILVDAGLFDGQQSLTIDLGDSDDNELALTGVQGSEDIEGLDFTANDLVLEGVNRLSLENTFDEPISLDSDATLDVEGIDFVGNEQEGAPVPAVSFFGLELGESTLVIENAPTGVLDLIFEGPVTAEGGGMVRADATEELLVRIDDAFGDEENPVALSAAGATELFVEFNSDEDGFLEFADVGELSEGDGIRVLGDGEGSITLFVSEDGLETEILFDGDRDAGDDVLDFSRFGFDIVANDADFVSGDNVDGDDTFEDLIAAIEAGEEFTVTEGEGDRELTFARDDETLKISGQDLEIRILNVADFAFAEDNFAFAAVDPI